MADPVLLANAVAGVALALAAGVAVGRGSPRIAVHAGPALAGLAAASLALFAVAMPVHGYATLLAVALLAAAWASGPLQPAPVWMGLAAGAAGAVALSVADAFSLWWAIPVVGLAAGAGTALRQAWRLKV